jgi:anaphase-promoting complex subunit 1
MDRGMLLERAREGREALKPHGTTAATPTLYSLLHPEEEMSVVSSTSTLSGLFSNEPMSAHSFGFRQPVQDLSERLILASDRLDASEPIMVTTNASSGRLSVWSYARVSPVSPTHLDGATSTSRSKGKAKETTSSLLSPSMSRMDRTMSASGKRKRSSLHGPAHSAANLHERERDRSTRQTSLGNGVGSSSLAFAGSADELDLLEALEEKIGGASSMKRGQSAMSTGLSSSDRRTSVTRNELSITMDRMALGHGSTQGVPGEIDREATMFADEVDLKKHPSDILIAKVWDMDLSSGG